MHGRTKRCMAGEGINSYEAGQRDAWQERTENKLLNINSYEAGQRDAWQDKEMHGRRGHKLIRGRTKRCMAGEDRK